MTNHKKGNTHMNAILIGGIIAAVVILGAWLRWAAGGAIAGYRIGVAMGGMLQAKKDTDPAPSRKPAKALEVVLAWLMPLRAARIIREQREDTQLLIRTLGHAVADTAEPLMRTRPDSSDWYDRPMPLAALTAILRPGRAVRKLRSADQSIAWMLDAVLAQDRKRREAGEMAASSK
jgi:hypothetical protein